MRRVPFVPLSPKDKPRVSIVTIDSFDAPKRSIERLGNTSHFDVKRKAEKNLRSASPIVERSRSNYSARSNVSSSQFHYSYFKKINIGGKLLLEEPSSNGRRRMELSAFLSNLVKGRKISDSLGVSFQRAVQADRPTILTLDRAKDLLIDSLFEELSLKSEAPPSFSSEKTLKGSREIEAPMVKKRGSFWDPLDSETMMILEKIRKRTLSPQETITFMRSNIEGRYNLIEGPFGSRLRVYMDYTASGQELRLSEKVFAAVAENYANTHSESSHGGRQMTALFEGAETSILRSMKADKKTHTVLAAGTGATGAIELVQKILGTYIPPKTIETICGGSVIELKARLRDAKRIPLVLITGYEHHSNETTWRNQLCDLQKVPMDDRGQLNLTVFSNILESGLRSHPRVIVSFSAGSNVTGIRTDILGVLKVVGNREEVITMFDFAAVAPYASIDLRLPIDAIFLSTHKFVGGPGAPGIAVIRNRIYALALPPTHGGGGTVEFADSRRTIFTPEISQREQSGTPGIVQFLRAGLAFELKELAQPAIELREKQLIQAFNNRFKDSRCITILGPEKLEGRAAIISFIVEQGSKNGERQLHPGLAVQLLNDLFGIQARAGCSCAGPYGARLLGVSPEKAERVARLVGEGRFKAAKFGWARLSLHFTFSDEDLAYALDSVEFLGEHGWRFLPDYFFDCASASWRPRQPPSALPKTCFDLLFAEKSYARDENARSLLQKQHLRDAYQLAMQRNTDFDLDSLEALGDLATFYVAKGNLLNVEKMEKACRIDKGAFSGL